ncbi:MAG TPA: carboxypeptidase regulatory-like domain-containing protein [Gemmatimonadaceae bacterium]
MPISRGMFRVSGIVAVFAATAVVPCPASAQDTAPSGSLVLTVLDSSGAGIADVQLRVAGTTTGGETNEHGTLRLSSVPAGRATIDARRLGFRPTTIQVNVTPAATAEATITLAVVARRLSPILVRGTAHNYSDRLAGFYQRRAHSVGHFFTRDQIENEHLLRLTDLFRRIPGMQITSTDVIQHAVRMRGESCAPLVWMDGNPLAAAEFDLDAVSPESVEAMEVYSGLAEVPPGFMGPNGLGSCGVIVLWSRVGQRKPEEYKRTMSASDLAKLVASLKVYTADEVDVPAHPDTSKGAQPVYPESLFAAHVSGRVVAEFVVDTTGHVLMESFGALSSTNPAFTEAVRNALPDATYVPAALGGRLVKQVVYQPFAFVADSAAAPSARQ